MLMFSLNSSHDFLTAEFLLPVMTTYDYTHRGCNIPYDEITILRRPHMNDMTLFHQWHDKPLLAKRGNFLEWVVGGRLHSMA